MEGWMGWWMDGWMDGGFTMEEIPSSPSLLFFGGFRRFCRILLCLASCEQTIRTVGLYFSEDRVRPPVSQ